MTFTEDGKKTTELVLIENGEEATQEFLMLDPEDKGLYFTNDMAYLLIEALQWKYGKGEYKRGYLDTNPDDRRVILNGTEVKI